MLTGLDWESPARRINLKQHWRQVVCILVSVIATTSFWCFLFPNVRFFDALWGGGSIGAWVGLLCGTHWQLKSPHRRSTTSARFMINAAIVWGLCSCMAIFELIPACYVKEQELSRLRSLKTTNVSAIAVSFEGQPIIRIDEPNDIANFVELAKNADLFYPSHEGPTRHFTITIRDSNSRATLYRVTVPDRHTADIAVRRNNTSLLIPQGCGWLDAVHQDTSTANLSDD